MDEDSTNWKKKRGKSLIFRKRFRSSSSANSGKILASDDNLVYCDVANNNPVEPEIKKSPSRGRRMFGIFKAVLFDAAVKKKMHRKKSSKTSTNSVNSSPERDEKAENIDNSLNDDNSNVEKVLDSDTSSNDESSDNSLSSKDVASEIRVPSSEISSMETSSKILTERKETPRINSMDKKPPLPNTQPSVKPFPAKGSGCDTLNNETFRLCLFIIIGIFVLVVVWMSFTAFATESSDIESDQHTNLITVADEL